MRNTANRICCTQPNAHKLRKLGVFPSTHAPRERVYDIRQILEALPAFVMKEYDRYDLRIVKTADQGPDGPLTWEVWYCLEKTDAIIVLDDLPFMDSKIIDAAARCLIWLATKGYIKGGE